MVEDYSIQAFAIGDGTAGRETEQFIKKLNLGLPVFLVNEDGAFGIPVPLKLQEQNFLTTTLPLGEA